MDALTRLPERHRTRGILHGPVVTRVAALALTLVLGGCGTAASPSPASTAAPTAAASAAAAATAAASAAATAAPSAAAAACEGKLPPEYKIGVNVGLTSWLAPYDTPAVAGFRMGVDEINAQGGIGGVSKIVLSVKDDRSDAAEAAKVSQELVDEGVDFVMLPGDASMAIPAGQAAQQAKLPMMSFIASTATQRDAVGDFFFSNGQADTLSGAGAAKYAIQAGYKTAYTLTSPDSEWLLLYPQYFTEIFEKLGGKVVGTDEFRVGNQDFSAQISKIKGLAEPPDVIFSSIYEPEWPAFIRQLRAAGVTTPFMGSDAIDTEATLSLGKTVDGVVAITNGFPAPGDPLDDFYTRYTQTTGERPPNVIPAIGYDTAHMLAQVVASICSSDPVAVRDAIEATKAFDGVLGTYEFGIIPGFPVRPLAVEQWNADASGKVTISKAAEITVAPDEIPTPRGG